MTKKLKLAALALGAYVLYEYVKQSNLIRRAANINVLGAGYSVDPTNAKYTSDYAPQGVLQDFSFNGGKARADMLYLDIMAKKKYVYA